MSATNRWWTTLLAVLLPALAAAVAPAVAPQDAKETKAPKPAATAPPVLFHLPFVAGFTVSLFQGNDQAPSHNDAYNQYAFDFSPLPEGTSVVAAADGVVVFVKEDTAGPTNDWHDNNRVIVRHRDGTFAEYTHLRKDGALVVLGQAVVAGDPIGESGNTGKSTQPHLHFNLLKDWNAGPSIPSRFVDVPGDGVPLAGQSVTSANFRVRDLPAFQALDGALRTYEFCESLAAIEAALPSLALARAVEAKSPPPPPAPIVDLVARRDALLQKREEEAARCRSDAERARSSGDLAEAAKLALIGSRDFADTKEGKALAKLAAELGREKGFSAAIEPLAVQLKFRRLLTRAIELEAKAATKSEKSAPPAWMEALRAFDRALEAVDEKQKGPLADHAEALRQLHAPSKPARGGSHDP